MAVRTTVDDVKVILETSLSDVIITGFINSANIMVDAYLTSSGLGTSVLEEIECWLAAHLIASTRDRTTETEKVGDAAVKYTGKYGMKLDATLYGQMVQVLDSSGNLASAGKRKAYITATESFDD